MSRAYTRPQRNRAWFLRGIALAAAATGMPMTVAPDMELGIRFVDELGEAVVLNPLTAARIALARGVSVIKVVERPSGGTGAAWTRFAELSTRAFVARIERAGGAIGTYWTEGEAFAAFQRGGAREQRMYSLLARASAR